MEKQFEQYLMNLDADASGFIGTFDENKKYNIDDATKEKLVKTNKLFEDYSETLIKAKATIGSFVFNFELYIQLGHENKKRVSIFLVEESKLNIVEKQTTMLDYKVFDDDAEFLANVQKAFNIFKADESEGVDMTNLALLELVAKLKQKQQLLNFKIKELRALDKEYVAKMLAILKGSAPYGVLFCQQFKDMVMALKLDKMNVEYWHMLKLLLDKKLLENISVFDPKTQAQLLAVTDKYIKVYNSTQQNQAVKPAGKSKGDAGSSGGKGSKGGGGKGSKGKSKPTTKNKGNGSAVKRASTSVAEHVGYGFRGRRRRRRQRGDGESKIDITITEDETSVTSKAYESLKVGGIKAMYGKGKVTEGAKVDDGRSL